MEYSLIEGSCRGAEVKDYLDALAERAHRMDKACVVVPDNAPVHTSGVVREREEEWAAKGLMRLYRLPAYCPHLNLIEVYGAPSKGSCCQDASTIRWVG